jgi:selenide, water dikinase
LNFPVRHPETYFVLFILGEIAFANVVSDVYACGVVEIDELKIILSIPEDLEDDEQQTVISEIVSGFKKSAALVNIKLSLENISLNPWCIIGGVATSVCTKDEIIYPTNAQVGDAIILTKPLGVQLATNAPIWMEEDSENWKKISEHLSRDDVLKCYDKAVKSMTMLNKVAAQLMHKYEAHACTDVTGFGLVGHAENLLQFQDKKLDFIITSLPVIKHVKKIAEALNRHQKLSNGRMVETSGGLLVILPAKKAQKFCDEFVNTSGSGCWIVGKVVSGTGKVITDSPQIVEV